MLLKLVCIAITWSRWWIDPDGGGYRSRLGDAVDETLWISSVVCLLDRHRLPAP